MPVFFEDVDRELGIPLGTCIVGRCRVLRNPSVPAPLGEKTTAHIRIVVSIASFGLWLLAEFEFRSPLTLVAGL